MALLGEAAIAMWWDIEPAWRHEFEHWHSHEHLPERLRIPGFRRGSRWSSADGGDGFFVLYELDRHETLSSPAYLARLNDPTPWSRALMPQHRRMVRSQCRVRHSAGAAIAHCALTVRLSPEAGREDDLRRHLADLAARLATQPGLLGGHLLQTAAPAIAPTTEQAIRGGPDPAADWIWIATAYDEAALRDLGRGDAAGAGLAAHGACGGVDAGLYRLCCAVTPADLATG